MICDGDNGPLWDILPALLDLRGLDGIPRPLKLDILIALKLFASDALLNASNSGF
jgi:hypothetical protein